MFAWDLDNMYMYMYEIVSRSKTYRLKKENILTTTTLLVRSRDGAYIKKKILTNYADLRRTEKYWVLESTYRNIMRISPTLPLPLNNILEKYDVDEKKKKYFNVFFIYLFISFFLLLFFFHFRYTHSASNLVLEALFWSAYS